MYIINIIGNYLDNIYNKIIKKFGNYIQCYTKDIFNLYIINIIGSKKAIAKFRTDEIRKARDKVNADDSHLNDKPERKEISRRAIRH